MAHLLHMALLGSILAIFFALIAAERGRRLRFGLMAAGGLVGGAVILAFLMGLAS